MGRHIRNIDFGENGNAPVLDFGLRSDQLRYDRKRLRTAALVLLALSSLVALARRPVSARC